MNAETPKRPAFPWHRNDVDRSGGLVSLWDIMEKHFKPYADQFVKNYGLLKDAISHTEHTKLRGGKGVPETIFHMIKMACSSLLKLSKDISLPVTASICESATMLAGYGYEATLLEMLLPKAAAIVEALEVELSGVNFMPILPSRVRYGANDPFGPRVAEKFKSARYDIAEAGICFASGRWTATVMHCMRVLEFGLDALGKALGVKRGKRGWRSDLDNFSKKWEAIKTTWKSGMTPLRWRWQLIPKIISQFSYFELAWRNHAMHAQESYGEVEAGQVFEHVMVFMQLISERMRETGKSRLKSTP